MRHAVLAALAVLLAGCATTVTGDPTWPGAALARAALGAPDFPPGVQYDRLAETPGQPDGAGAPGPMLSRPEGCSNALTNVIAQSAERGPGSALKYSAAYDGARIMMTLLAGNLDLERLSAQAARCSQFEAFFDPASDGIPIVTTDLTGLAPDALAYQQTMTLGEIVDSVYMGFQNVGSRSLFAIAYPTPNPDLTAKGTLPQTFLDVFTKQADRLRSS